MAGIDDVNRHPVIHTWSYKLAEAAGDDFNHGNADLATAMGVVCPSIQLDDGYIFGRSRLIVATKLASALHLLIK